MTTGLNEINEIDRQIAELQAKRQALLDTNRQDALSAIRQSIEMYGFSAADLGLTLSKVAETPVRRKRTKRDNTPKFFNPANNTETWSGFGPKPTWYKEFVKAGGNLDEITFKPVAGSQTAA